MLSRSRAFFLIAALSLFILSIKAKAEIKTFKKQSLHTIETSYTGKPFLLLAWSIDCLPCRQELAMISEIKTEYPKLNFSTLATESPEQFDQLQSVLEKYHLLEQDNWGFEHTNSARLRFELDPSWYGELPRAYFYDSKHKRHAVSGKLQKSQIINWLSKVSQQH